MTLTLGVLRREQNGGWAGRRARSTLATIADGRSSGN
jgi:hypothetical protein